MSLNIEVVDCPKCQGKMVPLSKHVYEGGSQYSVIPLAEWRCVKCGYSIETGKNNPP